MRNPVLQQLDVLIGEWKITVDNCWFFESLETQKFGHATIAWLGEGFVTLEAEMEGEPAWHFVFGRSDADDQSLALYHDPRGTSRLFRMELGDGTLSMARADPDMHQRMGGTFTPDRIAWSADASDDAGVTWRKDFDLVFDRI